MTKNRQNIAQKILSSHLIAGSMISGEEIQLKRKYCLVKPNSAYPEDDFKPEIMGLLYAA